MIARPGRGAEPAVNAGEVGVRKISARFDRGPTAVSAARHALTPLDDRVDGSLLDDVRLLVSELVTNSVRHSDGGPGGSVALDVKVEPERLRVEVSDPGVGFEPKPRYEGQSAESGWGLYLVESISDRWGVANSTGTNVWFEIDGRADRPLL
jgi:anti-sigma regulatory factor (Ser/Thr protein kinase)